MVREFLPLKVTIETYSLDLIPSAMIQTIEVNKTLTPDMEADAIGGSVNLITRSNPSGFRASLNCCSWWTAN